MGSLNVSFNVALLDLKGQVETNFKPLHLRKELRHLLQLNTNMKSNMVSPGPLLDLTVGDFERSRLYADIVLT